MKKGFLLLILFMLMSSTAYSQIDSSNTEILVFFNCVPDTVDDEPDGTWLQQRGQVVQIKPSGFEWGRSEIPPDFLVFRLLGRTPLEVATFLEAHEGGIDLKGLKAVWMNQLLDDFENSQLDLIDGRIYEIDISTNANLNKFIRDNTENVKKNERP